MGAVAPRTSIQLIKHYRGKEAELWSCLQYQKTRKHLHMYIYSHIYLYIYNDYIQGKKSFTMKLLFFCIQKKSFHGIFISLVH